MSEAEAVSNNDGGEEFSPTRTHQRYVPLKPVSAVLLADDCYVGHGIVSNISTSGACLITNTMVQPGQRIRVQLSTNGREELFQSSAKIVWAGEGMDPQLEIVGVMVGVQFLDVDSTLEEKITETLEQGRFHEVAMPSVGEEHRVLAPPVNGR